MRYNSMTSLSLKGITGSSIPKKELYLSKKTPNFYHSQKTLSSALNIQSRDFFFFKPSLLW